MMKSNTGDPSTSSFGKAPNDYAQNDMLLSKSKKAGTVQPSAARYRLFL